MSSERNYQYDYAASHGDLYFNEENRIKKAVTMLDIINDYFSRYENSDLKVMTVLDLGSSTGYIDNYIADYFLHVTGIDIDAQAIAFAQDNFNKNNLIFKQCDAMNTGFDDDAFDLIICSHVYEHVPDDSKLMTEIYRLLKRGGACYFTGGNRYCVNEPHYNLPFLSAIPRPLAHLYLRACGKGSYYHEKHRSYWGLKQLALGFRKSDYTRELINDPEKYHIEYMLPPKSIKSFVAGFIAKYLYGFVPSYIWMLRKP